jgi:hypothetical protein
MVGMKTLEDLFSMVSSPEVFKIVRINGVWGYEPDQSVDELVGAHDGGRKEVPVLAQGSKNRC